MCSALAPESNARAYRADILIALILAAANLLMLTVCWKIQGVQADESTYIYGALEMLKGRLIYRDFWVFYPPGIFFLAIGAFTLLGKSLFAVRLVLIAGACVTTGVLYLLGRRFMPRLPSAVASILFIVAGVNLWPVFGHHWNSTFALVCSAYFMVLFLERPRNGFLVLSGLFAGATLLLQLHKGVPLVAASLAILLARNLADRSSAPQPSKPFVKAAMVFLLCSLIPVGMAAVYLLSNGVLQQAVAAVIIFPYRHLAGVGNPDYGVPYGAFSLDLLSSLMKFLKVPGITPVSVRVVAAVITLIAPLSALLVPGILLIRRKRFTQGTFEVPLFVCFASLACLAASVSRPDFHHLLTAVPMGYLTLAFVVYSIALPRTGGARSRLASAVVAAVFAALLAPTLWVGAGTFLYGMHVEKLSLDSPLGFMASTSEGGSGPLLLSPYESLIAFIKMNTEPGERIFVMPSSPFLYYLTDRESAARFPMLMSSMNDAEQMAEIIADLERDRTRWVILDPAASWRQFKVALPYADEREFRENPLLRYIHEHYRKVADYGGFEVMERFEDNPAR